MALHPGEQRRHFPAEAPVAWDPIRRDLQENEDWYRDLVEHSQDLLCVHDLEGRFLSVNPVPARLLGYSVEELLRTPMRNFIPPEFRGQFDAYLREIAATGESHGLLVVLTRAGEQRIWEYHNTLRTEGVPAPIVRGIAHDVTERVRAEQALRASNAQLMKTAQERERILHELTLFRSLLDQSTDAILVVDPESRRFLDANERACADLGYSREELLAMTVHDVDPVPGGSFEERLEQQLREAGFAVFERTRRRKDGTTFAVEVNLRRVRLDREYDLAVSRDITARKRTEEGLQQSEAELREAQRVAHMGSWRQNLKTQGVSGSEQLYRIFGLEPTPVPSPFSELGQFFLPDSWQKIVQANEKVARTGESEDLEVEFRRPDGTTGWVLVRTETDTDGAGKLHGLHGIALDITERKMAEAALRESEERSRLAQEAAQIGTFERNLRTGENQWTPQMEVLYGLPPGGFPRTIDKFVELVHPDDQPQVRQWISQSMDTGEAHGEWRVIWPDGTVRWISGRWRVFKDGSGQPERVIGMDFDITERRRTEEELRESERRNQLALQIGKIGALEVDLENGRGTWTRELAEIWGIPSGFEGNLATFCWERVHPQDLARVQQAYAEAVQAREEREVEFRVLRPDGVLRWIRFRGVAMEDKETGTLRGTAVNMDITEQKRAEESIATLAQVRADSSENFFSSMALELAKCLEAEFTIIGEIVEGQDRVKTLGVCNRGTIGDNFTYDLADTPCAGVAQQGTCTYVSGVAEMFPKDILLKKMSVEGYAGTPLRDSQGRAIGILVALSTRPLTNAKFAEGILQLFSTRTAAEIERKRTEEALRQSEERFRVALKNSPIAVFTQDRDLRYTWIYNTHHPWPAGDLVGKTLEEFFGLAEGKRITEIRRRVLETGEGVRHEVKLDSDGRTRYFDTTIEPVRDASGTVVGITGASMDVTALREAGEALHEAQKKLNEEKLYLEQEIDAELGFGEIIGRSKPLQMAMEQVGKVASSDATVLLLGETGTGKELVARAIHRLSQRAHSSFIKLNCAAIPSGLLESELFGNEKGAFTGAVSRKIGRLELADKGTLFLDEIGDISLALQPKLLRVLQDQEFERLGGTHTLKVDFRLIAATNRDLAECVMENEFRSDLYYRLNVFPIRLPPLRERREDIQLLVEHFVQKFARKMKKTITSVPKKTMDALRDWDWPGNIRELENFVERSVILTHGSVLVAPLSELKSMAAEERVVDESLEAAEREHILRALRESHGKIGGLRGAAMRLGLKRTTLQSKLKHLGINPRSGSH